MIINTKSVITYTGKKCYYFKIHHIVFVSQVEKTVRIFELNTIPINYDLPVVQTEKYTLRGFSLAHGSRSVRMIKNKI